MSSKSVAGHAILGAGLYAKETHIPALARLGTAATPLKAVYSRTEKSAKELADEATEKLQTTPDIYHDGDPTRDLDALLARPDITAVNVVLPITLQPSIILKALAAGKHVISAKPLSPDVAEGNRLISIYNEKYRPKGLVWKIAEHYESEPGYITAGRLIREGKIGKVALFNARIVNYMDKESKWYKTPWRTKPDYQGGFLLDGGVHFTSMLRAILPTPFTHLSSFASLTRDFLAPEDTIHVIAKTADGAHGIYELTFAAPTPSLTKGNYTIITGTSGYLTVESAKATDSQTGKTTSVIRITIRTTTTVDGKPGPEEEQIIDEPVWGVEAGVKLFFDAAAGEKVGTVNDPEGTLLDVAFIEAALNSNGNLVDIQKLISQA